MVLYCLCRASELILSDPFFQGHFLRLNMGLSYRDTTCYLVDECRLMSVMTAFTYIAVIIIVLLLLLLLLFLSGHT